MQVKKIKRKVFVSIRKFHGEKIKLLKEISFSRQNVFCFFEGRNKFVEERKISEKERKSLEGSEALLFFPP